MTIDTANGYNTPQIKKQVYKARPTSTLKSRKSPILRVFHFKFRHYKKGSCHSCPLFRAFPGTVVALKVEVGKTIVAFAFDNTGLMVNLSIDGPVFSKLKK